MNPGFATLKFYQGGTRNYLVTHKSVSGIVRDYTGYTFACIGKTIYSNQSNTFELTTANGLIEYVTLDGVKKIRLKFTDDMMASVPSGKGVWDLFAFSPAGEAIPILYGDYYNQRRVPTPNA